MKILFISMPSIHAVRWIENLSGTEHELFWFDVLGKGKLPTEIPISQIINWEKRKIAYIQGEYFLRRKLSVFYNILQPFLEVTVNEKFVQILEEIQPDVVHSFEMQSCSYPILKTMNNYPNIKWVYSCWGSDLFYYQNQSKHLLKIKKVLSRINYLHTDCQRDFEIAKALGFKGKHLGVIPGGTGYDLKALEKYIKSPLERKIILVKGYQHQFGRGLNVVKALKEIQSELLDYEVVVFGAHPILMDYINQNGLSFKVYDRHGLKHEELLKLMGESLIYIGNSISDGMPNTLLEAFVMGAFPIQSNPGGATEEIIEHGKNGFLINDTENIEELMRLILQVIGNRQLLENANKINEQIAKDRLDYALNQQKILTLYKQIENDTCE